MVPKVALYIRQETKLFIKIGVNLIKACYFLTRISYVNVSGKNFFLKKKT